MRWRRKLIFLHRDAGFLCLGLTLVYGVSGVAVNHRHHWDFNRSIQVEKVPTDPAAKILDDLPDPRPSEIARDPRTMTGEEEALLVRRLVDVLGRDGQPRNVFWRGPDRLSLFFHTGDEETIDYEPSTGTVTRTVSRDRLLLRDFNYLHLNEGHSPWTWVADLYAVLLLFLAISGTIVVKGRYGFRGRGGMLAALGVLTPVVALVVLRYW